MPVKSALKPNNREQLFKYETSKMNGYTAGAKNLISIRTFFDSVLSETRNTNSVNLMLEGFRTALSSQRAQIPNIKRSYGGDYIIGYALERFAYQNLLELGHL